MIIIKCKCGSGNIRQHTELEYDDGSDEPTTGNHLIEVAHFVCVDCEADDGFKILNQADVIKSVCDYCGKSDMLEPIDKTTKCLHCDNEF